MSDRVPDKYKKALSMAVKLAMLAPKKSETDKAILALLAEAEQLEAEIREGGETISEFASKLVAAEAEKERLKDENELLREVVGSMPASYIVAWSDESRNALMALAALPALIALAPLARDAADTEEREGKQA